MPAWVYVSPTNDPGVPHNHAEMVQLDKEGHGLLPSQPPGNRRILVQGFDFRAKAIEFTVDPERPLAIDVLLEQ